MADPSAAKFVEIDVVDVSNPKRIRLAFDLFASEEKEERRLLGTFALFPPDHPGNFIVSPQGRLRTGSALVLSMRVLDDVTPDDTVRVEVRRMSLRKE